MRCFALATLMSASVLVAGATTALSDESLFGKIGKEADKKTDAFIDRAFNPPDIKEESRPVQQHPDVSQPDWMKDAYKLKPLGNPRNYERPFGQRFKDKAAYERAVLDILRAQHSEYSSNGEAMRFATIMIDNGWVRHDEPNVVVEDFLKFVNQYLEGRKTTTEARKKANQRVAKKPSALQEAVTDPELAADAQADYGDIASTLLSIGGAAIPMVRGASVPSVRPAVRVPTPQMRAPAPVIRTPTSTSTITGN